MKANTTRFEKAQSLVIVAALMLVFLGLLAIAIDVGNVYINRRAAQNAADAGALAGANILCATGDVGLAEITAEDYAENRNRAVTSVAVADLGNATVTVNTNIPVNMTFARFFGRNTIDTPAVAAAGCFPPGAGTGVLPIAWSCRYPIGQSSGECEMEYEDSRGPDDDECTLAGNDPMYIIVDTETIEDEILCQTPPNSNLPLGALDCDNDNDGEDDIYLISGGNRSWLFLADPKADYNAQIPGAGAAAIKDWVQNGFPYDVFVHTWFAGQTGAIASIYKAVETYQLDKVVVMPVFDQYCPDPPVVGDPYGPCASLVHPDDEVVKSSPHDYFHVISFALFHVTCVCDTGNCKNKCEGYQAANFPKNQKTIEGCFVEGYVPGLRRGTGSPWNAGAYTIYLSR